MNENEIRRLMAAYTAGRAEACLSIHRQVERALIYPLTVFGLSVVAFVYISVFCYGPIFQALRDMGIR